MLISSLFSHGEAELCPSRLKLWSKSSALKWPEHTRETLDGSHFACFPFTKSTLLFCLFSASENWYHVKANTLFWGDYGATAPYNTPSTRHLQEVFCSWCSRSAFIFSWKQALFFLKWHNKSTWPILPYSSVMNLEEANVMNSEKSQKINNNSYEENFFIVKGRFGTLKYGQFLSHLYSPFCFPGMTRWERSLYYWL